MSGKQKKFRINLELERDTYLRFTKKAVANHFTNKRFAEVVLSRFADSEMQMKLVIDDYK